MSMKSDNSCSWFIYINTLIHRYERPNVVLLIYNPPEKEQWKKQVLKKQQHTSGSVTYRKRLELNHLLLHDLGQQQIRKAAPSIKTDPLIIYQAAIRVRLLVQSYPLSTSHASKQR